MLWLRYQVEKVPNLPPKIKCNYPQIKCHSFFLRLEIKHDKTKGEGLLPSATSLKIQGPPQNPLGRVKFSRKPMIFMVLCSISEIVTLKGDVHLEGWNHIIWPLTQAKHEKTWLEINGFHIGVDIYWFFQIVSLPCNESGVPFIMP